MPDRKRETQKRQLAFIELRLLVSKAIFRNLIDTNTETLDISAIPELQEIVDEYSLRILITWLATKYGWRTLSSGIDSINLAGSQDCSTDANHRHATVLSLNAYPFAGKVDLLEERSLHLAGQDLLSERLSTDPALIGAFYEHMCSYPLVMDAKDEQQIRIDMPRNDKRKIIGQFYTPPSVVQYCYAIAWRNDLMEFMNRVTSSESAQSAANARNAPGVPRGNAMPRILDPSCGTGNFLAGAIDYLSSHEDLKQEHLIEFARNGLFGVELDARAACLAPFTITLALAKALTGTDCDYDRLFADIRNHIRISDSLYDQFEGEKEMDIVITNPPYVSYGARNQPKISGSHAGYLKSIYPNSSEYKVRTHSIFQDLCLNLARPGGRAVLLVPDAFLTGSQYKRLRKELLGKSTIDSLSELPDDAIPGATVGRWCVASYIRDVGCDKKDHKPVDLYSVTDCGRLEDGDPELTKSKKFDLHFRVPHATLISQDKQRIHLVFSEEDRAIAEITNGLPVLRERLRGHTGMRSLRGRQAIVSGHCMGPTWRKGLESGSRVKPFEVSWDGHWLNVDTMQLYAGGFDATVIGAAKILVRQTGDNLIAALDRSGLYHLNNIHSFSPAYVAPCSNFELTAFEALLNSAFYRHVYRMRTREHGRALAQVDIDVVEALPLPPDNPVMSHSLQKLVDRLKHFKRFRICLHDEMSAPPDEPRTVKTIDARPDLTVEGSLEAAISDLRSSIDDVVFKWFGLPPNLIEHIMRTHQPQQQVVVSK